MKAKELQAFEYVFNPRTVAIIGASPTDDFTQALIATKIRERVYFVNPKRSEVFGKKCYASVLDIEDALDYAILVVPTLVVPKVLTECIEKGVKLAHIYTAGFSETGLEERVKLENEVRELARDRIRLIGPNGMGIYCPKSGLSFVPGASTQEGTVGVITQSGTFGERFSTIGYTRNIGVSKLISYGNGIDLDCPDFLEFLADDPETEVIALYVEGTRDGERFKSALSKAARKKPVVALKGGMSEHGSRAASSHTGSLTGSAEMWSALFKQTGVVQVENFDQLLNTIAAFVFSPLPAGKGVSIITNSGGFGVVQTDLCAKAGLETPRFGQETMRELAKIVPTAGTGIGNPLDAWPLFQTLAGESGPMRDAIRIVASDENVDSLMLYFGELNYLRRLWEEALEDRLRVFINVMLDGCGYARDRSGKPVMICIPLDAYSEDEEERKYSLVIKKAFESRQFPVYASLDEAAKALFNLYKYGMRFRN